MTLNIYTHPSFLQHDTGPGHPERIDRLRVLLDLFDEQNIDTIPAREAERSEILRVHPDRYISKIEDSIPDDGLTFIDGDTAISPGSWEAVLHAAGAVCQAVDDVMSDACDRAFCAVRPPGHHAGTEQAEGFCLFNNIMIGALHAQAAHNTDRVAIIDFDVHHGNGSDEIARRHSGLFYASTHQHPLYPGTGLPGGNVPGQIVNVPLAAGQGSIEFRAAWQDKILPALDDFKPELLMISAGFDAHRDDKLAQINLTADDFAWVTEKLIETAASHCRGRVISVLEGGYNLDALKESTAIHLAALKNS